MSFGINIHVYPTAITHESRMLKVTLALAQAGIFSRIYLVGVRRSGLPNNESLDRTRSIVRLAAPSFSFLPSALRKLVSFAIWSWKLLVTMRREPIACINCHSLSALPVCALLKAMTGGKLVYDTHELETETNGNKGIRRFFSRFIERSLIAQADHVVVVGAGIAKWYEREYRIPTPTVVLNCPPQREYRRSNILRSELGISEGATIFLYQGIFAPGRGVELLLQAFQLISDPNKVVVFMGMGPLEAEIDRAAASCASVYRRAAVRPDQIAEYTASADVGLCLIEDSCLSYRLCMPNKLFEYLSSGLPVIVSNLPEISAVTMDAAVGWVVENWSSDAILMVLRSVDKATLATRQDAVRNAALRFCWENEIPNLMKVYSQIGFALQKGH